MEHNEKIIVMGDLNQDVRHNEHFVNLGLVEVISSRFRDPPPTYNRSKQFSRPIDGIWISPEISVRKSGYSGFDEGSPSDHRLIWIDVDFPSIFGCPWNSMPSSKPKRLKCKDPRLVKKYNNLVTKEMKEANLFVRIQQLFVKSKTCWNRSLEKEYNEIYREQLKIRKKAESRIRKLKTGAVAWSPTIQHLRDKIELWILILRRKRKVRTNLTKIRRLITRTKCGEALRLTRRQVWSELQNTLKSYHNAKKSARNLRNSFLDSLAQAVADDEDIQKESALKRLKNTETTRRTFRRLHPFRKKQRSKPVVKLYTSASGSRQEVTDKTQMEKAIIGENTTRFLQSRNTPFLQDPLLSDIGILGDKHATESILKGEYTNSSCSRLTSTYIKHLKRPQNVHEDVTLSTFDINDHIKGWSRAKESTAAEPHGLQFPHFKAALKNPDLAAADYILREIPFRTGFSPKAWQTITDLQIYKKNRDLDVELMRTITLFSADFNMNNKLLGKRIMHQAEKFNILQPEQFGSRKKHKAVTVALNQRLTFDLCRQRRQALAIASVDAKSCYDRIVHNVASINIRRLGIPIEPLLCMFRTLQLAHHHVMTAFGVSSETYHSLIDIPLQGIGQGNGAGPAIWAVINSPIISMIRQAGGGAIFRTAIAMTCLKYVGFSFVDDADIVCSDLQVDTPGEELIPRIQNALDVQNGGLHGSGGALKSDKCNWRLLDWEESDTGWELRSLQDMPGELSMLNYESGEREPVERLDTNIARETLGVYISPDGSWTAQKDSLAEILNKFSGQLKTANLSKSEVKCAIECMLWKKLEYSYPVSGLSKADWDEILKPAVNNILNALGTNRHFPRVLLFGPEKYQGMGLTHPYDAQMISQIITLISEGNNRSITGKIIDASLEQFLLEIGTYQGINSDVHRCENWVTESWIKNIWRYSKQHMITIHHPHQIPLMRSQDSCIMDVISKLPFSKKEMYLINEVRLHLQVISISDISDASGRVVLEAFYEIEDICERRHHGWPRKRTITPPCVNYGKRQYNWDF